MSERLMRAKMEVSKVERFREMDRIICNAVAAKAYPADGSDEDNTYAKFSPSAHFEINVANPALIGQFAEGEVYYVDFTPVPAA